MTSRLPPKLCNFKLLFKIKAHQASLPTVTCVLRTSYALKYLYIQLPLCSQQATISASFPK